MKSVFLLIVMCIDKSQFVHASE